LNLKFSLVSFAFLVLFTGCDSKENNTIETIPEVTKITQTIQKQTNKVFELKTTDNKIINISKDKEIWTVEGYHDKIILLDFFATWCPPCKAEIPHLNNIYKQYKDQFEIIGILLEDGKPNSEVQSFIDEYKIKYTITNDAKNQQLASVIGNVRSIPTMFLINLNGKIIQKYVGIVPEEMLASDIKRALKK
jgi:thiol-disulfide isomerase/thioredoxin